MTIIATQIKQLDGWKGDARLFRLSQPIEVEDTKTEYVIVSAVVARFSGAETYIFPAHEDGRPISYRELDGSYRGGLSHREAIECAGWELAL